MAPARGARRSTTVAAVVAGFGAALVGYAGAGVPSYWGDEAASVISARRPWPSLALMLGEVDAVHGMYYALLHVWIDVFGHGEWATRASSSLAVGLLVAGTVVLASRWFSLRLGVIAGVICAMLPRTTEIAIDTRSYALGAAAAVWLTVLLAVLVERRVTSIAAWIGYGIAMAGAVTLFVYLALLVLVHAVVIAAARPSVAALVRRGWLIGIATAAVCSLPIAVAAFAQHHQIGFLLERNYATPDGVLVLPWFGTATVAITVWTLVVTGVAVAVDRVVRERRTGAEISGPMPAELPPGLVPAVAWLVGPIAVVLVVDVAVAPTYSPRYVTFSVPAVAMLAALGVSVIAEAVGTLARRVAGRFARMRTEMTRPVIVIMVAGLAAISLSEYLSQRGPFGRFDSDLRQAAEHVASVADSGDAIVFEADTLPSQAPRLALHLYPQAFAGLRDVQLRTSHLHRAGLWDEVAPLGEIAGDIRSSRVWAVQFEPHGRHSRDVEVLESAGFRVVDRERVHRTVVYELQRVSAGRGTVSP